MKRESGLTALKEHPVGGRRMRESQSLQAFRLVCWRGMEERVSVCGKDDRRVTETMERTGFELTAQSEAGPRYSC